MEVTREDAYEYIAEAKQKLRDQPEKYREFKKALLKFKQRQIDYRTLLLTVAPLINGHQDLILGFKKFLPKNSTLFDRVIKVSSTEPAVDLTLSLAGNLEEIENSSHRVIKVSSTEPAVDLTLSLAGNLEGSTANQGRNGDERSGNSSRDQDESLSTGGGNVKEEEIDLNLGVGGKLIQLVLGGNNNP